MPCGLWSSKCLDVVRRLGALIVAMLMQKASRGRAHIICESPARSWVVCKSVMMFMYISSRLQDVTKAVMSSPIS